MSHPRTYAASAPSCDDSLVHLYNTPEGVAVFADSTCRLRNADKRRIDADGNLVSQRGVKGANSSRRYDRYRPPPRDHHHPKGCWHPHAAKQAAKRALTEQVDPYAVQSDGALMLPRTKSKAMPPRAPPAAPAAEGPAAPAAEGPPPPPATPAATAAEGPPPPPAAPAAQHPQRPQRRGGLPGVPAAPNVTEKARPPTAGMPPPAPRRPNVPWHGSVEYQLGSPSSRSTQSSDRSWHQGDYWKGNQWWYS